MSPGDLVCFRMRAGTVADGGICSASDLHDSAQLSGLQRHLRHASVSFRRDGASQLQRRVHGSVHCGSRGRSCRRRRDRILLSAVHLPSGLRISGLLPLPAHLWLHLLLPQHHGRVRCLANCIWPIRKRHSKRFVQSVHRHLCAHRVGLNSVWPRLRSTAYNPYTGASAATKQGSNGYSSWGSSAVSKNGQSAYSQHYTTSQGTTGSIQTSSGAKAAGASGAYGNSGAVAKGANGDMYASANGNVYKNTGNGWSNANSSSAHSSSYSGSSSYDKPSSSEMSSMNQQAQDRQRGEQSDHQYQQQRSSGGWGDRGGGGGWGGGGGRRR